VSQGDVWLNKRTGERGIEIAHNDDYVQLSFIQDDWPFPTPPVWVLRKDCERIQSRYHSDSIEPLYDMEEAPI